MLTQTRTKRITSSMRVRLSWRRLLIQVRISFLPTKYALSIIPILDAICFERKMSTYSSNNPMGKKPTITLLDKGIKILGVKSEGGVTRLNPNFNLYFQKKKRNRKNGRKWIEWTNGEELIWFFCSQRKQKPEQDSGHNQTVPKQRERKRGSLSHSLLFDTYNVC